LIEEMLCKGHREGPPQIKPVINALQDFFTEASRTVPGAKNVPVLESLRVRRELFKLYYLEGEFVLNTKADAFEAFDTILQLVHYWVSFTGSESA